MKLRLARLFVFLFALAFPILSVASEFLSKDANFVLRIGNATGGDIWINGPASNGVAGAPAFTCQKLVSGQAVEGPFTWERFPPGTALYAFSTGGQCGSNTNVMTFQFGNSQCGDQNSWRVFHTVGVITCLSWSISDSNPYVLLNDRTTDPGSGLPEIVLQIAPK